MTLNDLEGHKSQPFINKIWWQSSRSDVIISIYRILISIIITKIKHCFRSRVAKCAML